MAARGVARPRSRALCDPICNGDCSQRRSDFSQSFLSVLATSSSSGSTQLLFHVWVCLGGMRSLMHLDHEKELPLSSSPKERS